MNEVLAFKNFSYYSSQDGLDPEDVTIQGEGFRMLIDLCFAHADRFSLHRCGWQGSNDGALEQALRPYCLGEYRSYACIHMEDGEFWEKCYIYPATEETKAILLRHIPHLFGKDASPAPEGHREDLEEKYAVYEDACKAASNKIIAYLDDCNARTGHDPDDESYEAFMKEANREANAVWRKIFDPKDFYSTMEDLTFFHGDRMFFETITHEHLCFAYVFADEFGQKLRELGEWNQEENSLVTGFSLRKAKKLVWYNKK